MGEYIFIIAVMYDTTKNYIDTIELKIGLNIQEWSLVLAALGLLQHGFNGVGEDKDGLDIGEDANDLYVKIKTRTYDAARHVDTGR